MPRKSKKGPSRVYHDGLIPMTSGDPTTYPEVVPDGQPPEKLQKHDKIYPEVAGAGATATTPTSTTLTGSSPLPAPPLLPHLDEPRNSGASLHQAWSELGDPDDARPPAYQARPWWQRRLVWVIAALLVVIIILAGILGAMASGAIKTAANSR